MELNPRTPRRNERYHKILHDLKTEGESQHDGMTYLLNDITHTCELYRDGEYLFELENAAEIYEYC